MDPKATLDALNESFNDGDTDAVLEHIENLRVWVERGGFLGRAIAGIGTDAK